MQPIVGILLSISSIQNFGRNRKFAIIGLTCVTICLICSILVIGFAILG